MLQHHLSRLLPVILLTVGISLSGQDALEPRATILPRADVQQGSRSSQLLKVRIWQPIGPNDRADLAWSFQELARGIHDQFLRLLTSKSADQVTQGAALSLPVVPLEIFLVGQTSDLLSGPPARQKLIETPDGNLKVDLYIRLHDQMTDESFRLHLMRAMLLSVAARERPQARERLGHEQPLWLVHGWDELLIHHQNGRPSEKYAQLLKDGALGDPQWLFETRAEGLAQQAARKRFRIAASAFTDLLLASSNSQETMRQLIAAFSMEPVKRPEPTLNLLFPELRELDGGLEQWWALHVAAMAQQRAHEFLSADATYQILRTVPIIELPEYIWEPDAKTKEVGMVRSLLRKLNPKAPETEKRVFAAWQGTLHELPNLTKRPDGVAFLQARITQLQHVRVHGFPLFRPVVEGYEDLLIQTLDGKRIPDLAARLDGLARMNEDIASSVRNAKALLDHYEATKVQKRSDTFDDYFRTNKRLREEISKPRRDRIGKILDEWEARIKAR